MAATGVAVRVYRERIAELAANLPAAPARTNMYIHSFSVGEMGWERVGGVRVPVPPPDSATNIIANIAYDQPCSSEPDPPLAQGLRYNQVLDPSEVDGTQPGIVTVTCTLPPTSIELDGTSKLDGNCDQDPKFFELGIFNANNDMIVYATFDEVVKQTGVSLEFTVEITY